MNPGESRPALTAAEWAKGLREVIDGYVDECLGVIDVRLGEYGPPPSKGEQARALAALLLHGQPFGFTWDDVDLLRSVAEDYVGEPAQETAPPLSNLADRIAALLPPREP